MNGSKTFYDEYIESLTPEARDEFRKLERGIAYKEMLYAAILGEEDLIQSLADTAQVSPLEIDAIRAGEDKTYEMRNLLRNLNYFKFTLYLKRGKEKIPVDLSIFE